MGTERTSLQGVDDFVQAFQDANIEDIRIPHLYIPYWPEALEGTPWMRIIQPRSDSEEEAEEKPRRFWQRRPRPKPESWPVIRLDNSTGLLSIGTSSGKLKFRFKKGGRIDLKIDSGGGWQGFTFGCFKAHDSYHFCSECLNCNKCTESRLSALVLFHATKEQVLHKTVKYLNGVEGVHAEAVEIVKKAMLPFIPHLMADELKG